MYKQNQPAQRQPNILWLVAEDMCPDLGCYGNPDSITPNLDRLASEGERFTHAFSLAPICSPARSCLISGMYPTTLGSHHMRSQVKRPDSIRCFTEYLRETGYYCMNGFGTMEMGYQTKLDYNFTEPTLDSPLPAWDAVSGYFPDGQPAHWRNRAAGQPFFAQIGFFITHSSQYGRRHLNHPQCRPLTRIQESELRDRENIHVPDYHPNLAGAKELWKEYHECITEMDHQVGGILGKLERDGLSDETIVFFFGDNGMGVPGGKSWLWDQGLHVPLLIRCPEKYRHLIPARPGSVNDRIVSFEDFAPTVLQLAGLAVPEHMQGNPFYGDTANDSRKYAYGIRDRHDHSYDCIRTIRDKRFHYNRNFMPHFDWLHVFFMWNAAPWMMKEWLEEARSGQLIGRQRCFFQKNKLMEELYDMETDPAQMNNLADDPAYREVLERMRKECEDWMTRSCDLGLLSEYEMHKRASGSTPYEIGQNPMKNPVRRLLDAAWAANLHDAARIPELVDMLDDDDSAVRRWGALGLAALKERAAPVTERLVRALNDPSPDVRIASAEALCHLNHIEAAKPILLEALRHESGFVVLTALWALDSIGDKARFALPQLRELPGHVKESWVNDPHILTVMFDLITDKLDRSVPRRASYYKDVDLKATREKYY